MSEIKLPRPLEDYLIGKYDNGNCCYLIFKEAHKSWFHHGAAVTHVCIRDKDGLDFLTYPLAPDARYKAFNASACPPESRNIIMRDNPLLWKLLFDVPKPAVKSEPTPDQYYIIKHREEHHPWFAVLREAWDTKKKAHGKELISWNNKHPTQGLLNQGDFWVINSKKFPQLGSDIKAELQKQNPERYKKWEDFYVKKYGSQGAAPKLCGCGTCGGCLKRMPLPDPAEDYIVISTGTLGLVKRKDFVEGKRMAYYDFNYGWQEGIVRQYDENPNAWPFIDNWTRCKGIQAIHESFKKYYTELEWKKEAFKQSKTPAEWCIHTPSLINQLNYTPNINQQNNEAINVRRKTITIIGGQKLSGDPIQSNRSTPSVTAGHPQHQQAIVSRQKRPGSIQVSGKL